MAIAFVTATASVQEAASDAILQVDEEKEIEAPDKVEVNPVTVDDYAGHVAADG